MPAFVHSALLLGLWIVTIPVVIHLINMLRHRRVEWAAMEFLLVSQKKNRTWVVFEQLLLLLMRMLAIATVVLIVAQPLLRNQLGNLFGNMKTHHIVLIDDSFSMSDRWADTSAFSEAKEVVRRIGAEAARQVQPQTFTLLRFSRVSQVSGRTQPELLKEPVTSDFDARLVETLEEVTISQTSAGPIHALEAISQWLGSAEDERQIVYLVSDFRTLQWEDPGELQSQLGQLNQQEAAIHLIHCVEKARANLAITALAPAAGIRARDVPWFMEVSVQNFGPTTAREVPVLLEEDGRGRPSVTIAEIPPGSVVTRRFPIRFPTAGEHRVAARIESDTVAADNYRYAAVDMPADVPVLLIDNPDARDARYLSMASAPGGSIRTGIRPQIETPNYLGRKPLDEFQAINLMNIERLDPAAVEALEQYIAGGGGVAIFLGEQCRSRFINDRLYRDGEGFFPVPLDGPTNLLVDRLNKAPDMRVSAHPIFRILTGARNSFLSTVIIERYFAVPDGWKAKPDSATEVIARLRNGAPLVVERRFGKGRVVAFLTSAGPAWNTWARNPSFVVAVQDVQAYLSRRPASLVSHRVGAKLELQLHPQQYQRSVRFAPLDQPSVDITSAPAGKEDTATSADAASTPEGLLGVAFSDTAASGFYQAELTRMDGTTEKRLYAVNVDAAEGNLQTTSGPELATRLEGIEYEYEQASLFQCAIHEEAGYNVSQWLLYLLIGLLIGEQILAFSASYHPTPRRAIKPAEGGVR